LLEILNNNYKINTKITNILYNNKGKISNLKSQNKILLDNYFNILENKILSKYNIILLKNENVLYSNLYNLAILITEAWNYILYTNNNITQNITLYFANENAYIFNPNSKKIKDIIRIFSKQNWKTIIWRLLIILNTLNN